MIFKLLLTHIVYSIILISKVSIVIAAIVRIAKEDIFKTLLYFRSSYLIQSLKDGIFYLLLLLLIHATCIILLHTLASTLL